MVRTTLIDLCPIELKYYPFMVSLDTFSGSYNFANDLSAKNISSESNKILKC